MNRNPNRPAIRKPANRQPTVAPASTPVPGPCSFELVVILADADGDIVLFSTTVDCSNDNVSMLVMLTVVPEFADEVEKLDSIAKDDAVERTTFGGKTVTVTGPVDPGMQYTTLPPLQVPQLIASVGRITVAPLTTCDDCEVHGVPGEGDDCAVASGGGLVVDPVSAPVIMRCDVIEISTQLTAQILEIATPQALLGPEFEVSKV